MEILALGILALIVAWWLGLLNVGASVVEDAGSMAKVAMEDQKNKQRLKSDQFYSNNKVNIKDRLAAEISRKQFREFSNMDLDELQAELAKITKKKGSDQQTAG